MEKLDLTNTVAYGYAAFAHLDKAEALYEQLVEKLYSLGDDVAARLDSPEVVADALVKAAQAHVGRRNGYKLAEKALLTACRILNRVAANDTAKLATVYRLLGHFCCRQGKHCQAIRYNTLAALLMVSRKDNSSH